MRWLDVYVRSLLRLRPGAPLDRWDRLRLVAVALLALPPVWLITSPLTALELVLAIVAGFVGALAAVAELITTFKDRPLQPLIDPKGHLYLAVHFFAGLVAFALLDEADITFTETPLTRVLIAGLAGPVVIRLKVFAFRSGDGQERSVGPGSLLDAFTETLRTEIDRARACERDERVQQAMHGIDFDLARTYARTHIAFARQTLSRYDKQDFEAALTEIDRSEIAPQAKADALGFLIIDAVGEEFLDQLFGASSDRARLFRVDDPDSPDRFRYLSEAETAEIDEALDELDEELGLNTPGASPGGVEDSADSERDGTD